MKLIDMGTAESNLGRDCPGYEVKMGCDVCGYYGGEDEFSGSSCPVISRALGGSAL